MRHHWVRSLAVLAALASLQPMAQAATGRTPGNFGVSSTGAATYSIPIWTPPGPKGLRPRLALAYNSQAGNGAVGVGWYIAGLGQISRCNGTYAQDTAAAPITLTTSDKFCLNGNRLRLTAGTYGVVGSTYQTEIADFSNVTAVGTQGNGPASFTVQGRDGLTYYYGATTNSQVLGSGTTTVYQWLLNQISDRSGNGIAITYTAETGGAEPSSITWNTPSDYYTLTFVYGTNVPQSSIYGYVAGTPVQKTKLLTNIQVSYTGTLVKNYILTYQAGATTARDRLHQVQECADSAGSNCLLPTVITYQDGGLGISTTAHTAVASSNYYTSYTQYDLDGDGRVDMVYYNGTTGTWFVAFSTGSGFGTPVNTGITSATALLGDVLGKGKDGFLSNNGGTWYYYSWNGTSFVGTSTGLAVNASASQFLLSDVDGDGLPDLISLVSYNVYTQRNTGSGSTPSFSSTSTLAYTIPSTWVTPTIASGWNGQYGRIRYFDFNGDARQDLVVSGMVLCGKTDVVTNPNGTVTPQTNEYCPYQYLLLSNGSTYSVATEQFIGVANQAYLITAYGNWNNDNCTDIATTSILYYSGCNGTAPTNVSVGYTVIGSMDWDGDGRTDLLVQNGTNLGVLLSTGAGFSTTVTTTSIALASGRYFTLDADGDGLDDLGFFSSVSPYPITYYTHTSPGQLPDLVTSIVDGYGNSASPTYVSLIQNNYTNGTDATYPDKNYIGALNVVNEVVFSDPSSASGGTYNQQFWYYEAWSDLQGRGFQGFYARRTSDSRYPANTYSSSYYGRSFPNASVKWQEVLYNATINPIRQWYGTFASITLNSTTNNQRYFTYFSNVSTAASELGGPESGDQITTSSTNYTYDDYGNATTIAQTVTDEDPGSPYHGDSWTVTTTNTPDVDTTHWCLGLFTQTQVAYTATIGSSVTRTKSFTPDTTNCRYTQVVTEPSSSTYKVTEAYGFDSFGNINSDTVTGIGMTARVTSINWGTTGQFPTTVTDPSSAETQFGYNFSFGEISSVTDPNGEVTSYAYTDGFGRKTQETRPDSTYTTYTYYDCAAEWGCLIGSHSLALLHYDYNSDGSAQTDGVDFYDEVDRPLVSFHLILGNVNNRNEVRYDSLGRVVQRMAPCLWSNISTACPYETTYTYDILNRVTQAQRPISSTNSTLETTGYQYAGRTTTVTDPNSIVTSTVSDVNGWLRQTKDALAYTVTLAYDAAGSKTGVTDSESHTLWSGSYAYGIAPFKISASDADLGAWTYTYDALGEITAWKDAKSQNFSETYDALSRPLTRSEPDLFSKWTWGSTPASHNVGQLTAACTGTGTNPTACNGSGIAEADTYDSVARLYQRTFTITGDSALTYTYQYGTSGMVSNLTYPVTTSGYALELQYGYSAGLLQSVTDVSDMPNVTLWTANAMNPDGTISQETAGNGVVTNRSYDAVTHWLGSVTAGVGGGTGLENQSYLYGLIGTVTQRQNNTLGLTENFYYDNDYRLTSSKLNTVLNLSVGYDVNGNITSRSDIAGGAAWTYDPAHYHEVTQAGSSSYTYTYDANGNAITRNGSPVTWTSYNYPSSITANDVSGTETVAFAYGPDRQRWQQNYNSGTEVTNYIGGLLEQVGSSAGTTWRHYIYAGREPVAVYSRTSTLVNTWSYFYTDHLGSIAGIANSSGVSDVGEAFTAFGARRNPTTWSGAPSSGDLSTIAGLSRQGYTFQTALGQSMGLNHMNGRVQDAITGRFLSADPNIPNPRNPQSYNRFSYVQNNPLTFVDPSGFLDDEPTLPEVTVPGVSIAPDGSDLLPQVTVPGTPLAPDGSDLLPQVTVPGTPLPGDSGLLPQVVVTPPPPPPGKSSPKGAVPGLPQHTKPSACVNPVVRVAQAVVGAAQVGYGLVQAIDGVLDVGAGIGGALETGGGSAALLIPIGAANVTLGSAAIGDGAMLLGAAMSGSGNAPTMFGLVGQRYGGESGAQTGEFANLAGQLASWAMSPPTSAQSAIINAGLMVLSDILPDAGTIGGQQCQNP